MACRVATTGKNKFYSTSSYSQSLEATRFLSHLRHNLLMGVYTSNFSSDDWPGSSKSLLGPMTCLQASRRQSIHFSTRVAATPLRPATARPGQPGVCRTIHTFYNPRPCTAFPQLFLTGEYGPASHEFAHNWLQCSVTLAATFGVRRWHAAYKWLPSTGYAEHRPPAATMQLTCTHYISHTGFSIIEGTERDKGW